MLPFIQGRLRMVAILAFKNPTSTTVYLKSAGWSNASLSPHPYPPTHTIRPPGAAVRWSQPPLLGEIPARRCCAPSGWADRVCDAGPSPFRVPKGEVSRSSRSGSAPREAVPPGSARVSVPGGWGRPAGIPGCLGFLMHEGKRESGGLISAGAPQLPALGEFLGCGKRPPQARGESVSPAIPSIAIQNYCVTLPRLGSLEGGEEGRKTTPSGRRSADLFKVKNRQDFVCRRQFVLLCCWHHVSTPDASAFED